MTSADVTVPDNITKVTMTMVGSNWTTDKMLTVMGTNSTTDWNSTMMGTNWTTDGVPTAMTNYTTYTNYTNYTSPTEPQLSLAFLVFYYSMKTVFAVLAILGNALTIVAVVRFERLQTNTSYLICSLAAADILGCVAFPVDLAHDILTDTPYFVPLCLVHRGIGTISLYLNFCSILGIAVDRYLLIAHPLHYPTWVTSARTVSLIAATWCCVIAEITLTILLSHTMVVGKVCKFPQFVSETVYWALYVPQLNLLADFTVGFYVAIGRIAYQQGKAIAALHYPTYEATLNQQHKKIAKMMGMVLGVAYASFGPLAVGTFVKGSSRTLFWLHYEKMAALSYWVSVWLNPFIYAWKSDDFRTAFRKLLGMKPVPAYPV